MKQPYDNVEHVMVTRYPDDKYDRRWWGHSVAAPAQAISTTTPVNVSLSSLMVPEAVMQTALIWPSGETMYLPLSDIDASNKFYYFVSYFAEIDLQAVNQSRVFDMVLNNNPALGFANVSVTNLAGGMYVTTLCEFHIKQHRIASIYSSPQLCSRTHLQCL
jgi:hypothetical protein